MKSLSVAGLAVLLLLSAGCVPIPTPELVSHGSRLSIPEETLKLVQTGSTTKEDVLLVLGEPDMGSKDEKNFLYWTASSQGVWISGAPFLILAGDLTRHLYVLLMEFDENDVVERIQLKMRDLPPGTICAALVGPGPGVGVGGCSSGGGVDAFRGLLQEEIQAWEATK